VDRASLVALLAPALSTAQWLASGSVFNFQLKEKKKRRKMMGPSMTTVDG
jgi:hypothetical protein